MLHHVSIEIDPADCDRMVEMWSALGFDRIEAPAEIRDWVVWLERTRTQVHLILTPEPKVPALGHAAVVAEDFDDCVNRLRAAGFAVEAARELWGEHRAFVLGPGGHRVEVMAAPPQED
jgi:catechol 2,3-dioxygenase-like lactoylglutathione lyase family enzyme